MPETRDIRSVVEAAEQAAAAGDFASAERLLIEVADLQEASLGPLHPDLANTLNNLGVVSEIREKPLDAERYFRRAFAIATAALPPDHPFVATSRKNLEDFCNTRGIAIDPPPPVAAVVAVRDTPPVQAADRPTEHTSIEGPRPVASRRWSAPLAIVALIGGGLIVTFVVTATRRSQPIPADVSKQAPAESSPSSAGPEESDTAPTAPVAQPIRQPQPAPPAVTKNPAIATSPSKPPIVVAAQLCRTLSTGGEWQCVPAGPQVGPGSLFFYSRLKSPIDTTVQHRWYHGDRLRQAVQLPIRANTSVGYRTYSRHTVDSHGVPDWRVELRTKDGLLLHEERFEVR